MQELSPKRTQTPQRLLDAAFRVLASDGFAGASIETIVAEAGFTRGAFYSNFESKEELFAAVVDREMRRRLELVKVAVAQLGEGDVPVPVTADVLGKLLEAVIVDPQTEREWQIVMTELELDELRNPGGPSALAEPDLAYIDEVAEALIPAVNRLGIEFDGDPDVIIRLLINGYLAVIRQALRGLPRGADISITPQLEWFTVLVEKFLRVPQD